MSRPNAYLVDDGLRSVVLTDGTMAERSSDDGCRVTAVTEPPE